MAAKKKAPPKKAPPKPLSPKKPLKASKKPGKVKLPTLGGSLFGSGGTGAQGGMP